MLFQSAELKLPDGDILNLNRGLVVFVCFLQGATEESVTKAVVAVKKVKLSEREESDEAKRVSVTETGGDILIIPQATLGQPQPQQRISIKLRFLFPCLQVAN